MLAIPSALQAQFEEYLRNKEIPNSLQGAYKKWLRYYLDFCQKYHFPAHLPLWSAASLRSGAAPG